MQWFNAYGLITVLLLMIPNILCGIFDKSAFENAVKNRTVEILEQIGRYGCFILMIVNIPYTYAGFWFHGAKIAYIALNVSVLALYFFGWVIFYKKASVLKALTLSILPSILFLGDGILLGNIPLSICALVFATGHIALSYKNAAAVAKRAAKAKEKKL